MRRLIATIALSAVFVAPLAALWCAYTCAADDDVTPSLGESATVSVNPSPESVTGRAVLAAHDDCAADLSNRATLATVEERATHAVSLLVLRVAAPSPIAIVPALAFRPAGFAPSPGSPPDVRFVSVLRI
jgi:hypothetical protein